MSVKSTAPVCVFHHAILTEDNGIHLSFDEVNGQKVNMQLPVKDAIRLFAGMCVVVPGLKNLCQEELTDDFVQTLANHPPTATSLSVHVASHPLYCKPRNLILWSDTVVKDEVLFATLTKHNAEQIEGFLRHLYNQSPAEASKLTSDQIHNQNVIYKRLQFVEQFQKENE